MILSGGEALVDIVSKDGEATAVPGGGPMNVAITAARLGVPAAFLGRVSTDEHGEAIWAHLTSNGVDVTATERGPEPTARAIVESIPKLSFRFEGENTADANFGAVNLEPLGKGPHILHGGTLGLFRGQTAATLADFAESHTGLISLDPNVRPKIIDDPAQWHEFHNRWVPRTHIYRGSDEDFEWIWDGRGAEDCAAELLDRGVLAVLVTRGPDGASVFTRSGQIDVGGQSVEVVDTVGAGDTFVGAMLTQLHELGVAGEPQRLNDFDDATWAKVASWAAAAAAITVSRLGADPPTRAELEASLS